MSPANRGPAKVQHTGREEDKDPGVDDGVNRDEAQGDQVQMVRLEALALVIPFGVDVHPDLRDGQREERKAGRRKREIVC